jgi:peptide/nickel transport system permease protein
MRNANAVRTAFHSGKFLVGFVIFVSLLLAIIIFPMVNHTDPLSMTGGMFESPSAEFPLGTDNFGRDVLVELVSGARTSLLIGFLAGVIATIIGLVVGLFAGYVGGVLDNILDSLTNIFIVIPSFVILILISVSVSSRTPMTTALVIGITSWPWTARAVRAQTTSLRTRDHVNLSKLSGHSTVMIILQDILPYVASYVMMAFILQIASGISPRRRCPCWGWGRRTWRPWG